MWSDCKVKFKSLCKGLFWYKPSVARSQYMTLSGISTMSPLANKYATYIRYSVSVSSASDCCCCCSGGGGTALSSQSSASCTILGQSKTADGKRPHHALRLHRLHCPTSSHDWSKRRQGASDQVVDRVSNHVRSSRWIVNDQRNAESRFTRAAFPTCWESSPHCCPTIDPLVYKFCISCRWSLSSSFADVHSCHYLDCRSAVDRRTSATMSYAIPEPFAWDESFKVFVSIFT